MSQLARRAVTATPLAVALTLAMTVGAAAQVASLVGPDETPEPETADVVLEFEDQNDAMLAYAQCLRDHGIAVDDPQAGSFGARAIFGGGPDSDGPRIDRGSEEFIAANESCGYILEASRPEIDPAAEQERLEEQLKLAQCIRDAGYPEYPDPVVSDDGRFQRGGGRDFASLGIDFRSEEFREVMTTCRDEMGLEEFGPGGGLGGGIGRGGN